MTEAEIERHVIVHCQKKGLITYKFTSPAHRGVPDRIIIGPNRVLLLELKQAGRTITLLQQRELMRINQYAGPNLLALWAAGKDSAIQIIDDAFSAVP